MITQTAPAIITEVGTESAIFVGPGVLVASKSNPGEWHTVLNSECSCVGFKHRGRCRHLIVAVEAQERDRESAELAEPHCRCGHPWTVRVEGVVYCGACAPRSKQTNHNWPGRYALYGRDQLCATCGTEYRGPTFERDLCWTCKTAQMEAAS